MLPLRSISPFLVLSTVTCFWIPGVTKGVTLYFFLYYLIKNKTKQNISRDLGPSSAFFLELCSLHKPLGLLLGSPGGYPHLLSSGVPLEIRLKRPYPSLLHVVFFPVQDFLWLHRTTRVYFNIATGHPAPCTCKKKIFIFFKLNPLPTRCHGTRDRC